MKVTVNLENIVLSQRIKQIEERKLNGNFIVISGRHYGSFSYRNGEFQRARFDNKKGHEAMEEILKLEKGLLTIDIIEPKKEKEQLWRIIENIPNILFCGIIECKIVTHVIIKKETKFSEEQINNFINYVMTFSERRRTEVNEVTLIFDYYLLYFERVRKDIYTVFLLPRVKDFSLITVSIRNITSRIKDIMFSGGNNEVIEKKEHKGSE